MKRGIVAAGAGLLLALSGCATDSDQGNSGQSEQLQIQREELRLQRQALRHQARQQEAARIAELQRQAYERSQQWAQQRQAEIDQYNQGTYDTWGY